MIINKDQLLRAAPIKGMSAVKWQGKHSSYGLTECGYDIRLAKGVWLFLGRRFVLRHAIEEFNMPNYLMGRVLNKSTWARRGVDASMTTNIEPGWRGFLTLELHYRKAMPLYIPAGVGIAQVIFEQIAVPTWYEGKYQDQPDMPVPAK